MKYNYFIIICLFYNVLHGQSVDVMNYNNGQKATVPTTSSTQLLPLTGATNSVQMWNGSTWTNTAVGGTTFQGLANYWTKTGNNLSYTAGDVTVGTVNGKKRFFNNGTIGITFNSDTVATGSAEFWLGLGSFTKFVKGTAGNFIYSGSGSTSAETFNVPIGALVLQARSDNNSQSNICFATGATPSLKGLATSTDFRFPYLTGNTRRFAVLGVGDELLDGPNLSATAASTGQVLKWDGSAWAPAVDNTVTVGAFQTTGTANGLSLSGTDIRLHSASLTAPGAVDLTDNQKLGANTKIFTKNSTGSFPATAITLSNESVNADDQGIRMNFKMGASSTETGSIESTVVGGSITGGTRLDFYNMTTEGTVKRAMSVNASNQVDIKSFLLHTTQSIGANFNASTGGIDARKAIYSFSGSGFTLVLPDPTTLPIGTSTTLDASFETGSTGAVSVSAGTGAFAWSTDQDAGTGGNQFFTDTITSISAMQSVTLTVLFISGQQRWKVKINQ